MPRSLACRLLMHWRLVRVQRIRYTAHELDALLGRAAPPPSSVRPEFVIFSVLASVSYDTTSPFVDVCCTQADPEHQTATLKADYNNRGPWVGGPLQGEDEGCFPRAEHPAGIGRDTGLTVPRQRSRGGSE